MRLVISVLVICANIQIHQYTNIPIHHFGELKMENEITAVLKNIISINNLNLLEFEKENQKINVLILQMNIDLKIGEKALLYIKPTKLFLSKEKCEFENVLKVKVKKIKKGKILANIICEITNEELEVLMLKNFADFETEAYLMFKASDISIIGKI